MVMDARFKIEDTEQLHSALLDSGVIFGRAGDDVPRVSKPLLERYGIGNAIITAVLETTLWVPSDSIPEWNTEFENPQ